MIVVFSGLPGAGKSLKLARVAIDILYRNKKLKKKFDRKLYTNLKFTQKVMDEFPDQIVEWEDPADLVKLRDCDILWDEIQVHLDSTQWQNMPLELKRWLQLHRHYGIDIYATSQDFAQVDKSARRLTQELIHITKLIGSPDKSATRPVIKHVWGICFLKTLDPTRYNEERSKFETTGIPMPMWISKKDIEIFDTTAEVKVGKYPPLRHIERYCEHDGCGHVKTVHV